jgi:hypothetical protein
MHHALHRGWPALHKTRPAALLTTATVHVAGDCDAKYLTGTSCDDGKKCTEHDKCDNYGVCKGTPTVCAPSAYPQCSYTKCDDYTGAPTFPCLTLRLILRCRTLLIAVAAELEHEQVPVCWRTLARCTLNSQARPLL